MPSWILAVALVFGAPLEVRPAEGAIRFEASSTLHSFAGSAASWSGRLDPERGTGTLVVDATTLTTGLGPRDARMRDTCLEVGRFPEIRFDVSSIEGEPALLRGGPGGGGVTLVGMLTIRDVARPVRVPAQLTWESGAARLKGRVGLAWADFGIPDPSVLLSAMSPGVDVVFDVLAG